MKPSALLLLLTLPVLLPACDGGTPGNGTDTTAANHAVADTGTGRPGGLDIQRRVEAALLLGDGLGRVDVTTMGDGVVHLGGSVGDEAARTRAGAIAGNVAGVRHVINDIVVTR